MNNKNNLNKTDYIQYLKCPQELWLRKNEPDFNSPPLTEQQHHIIDQGNEIDRLAQDLFDIQDFKIKAGIEHGSVIYQKKATVNSLVAIADIFVAFENRVCWLFEVKAATKVKDDLLNDIAFQKVVFEEEGYRVEKCFLVHVNTAYEKAQTLNLTQLLMATEVTEQVEVKYEAAKKLIPEIKSFLEGDRPPKTIPFRCKPLRDCQFLHYTYDVPEYSVLNISRISAKKLQLLLEQDIWDIKNVPDDFKLSAKQRLQVEVAKSNEPHIDKAQINEWLSKVKYPLYFLDYESFSYAIPFQEGINPYQQAIFQYSLHVQVTSDSDVQHYEYLLPSKDASIEQLVEHLADKIKDLGSIVVWNKAFEKTRNKELAAAYLDYNDFFTDLNERMIDLEIPFKKQWYVHPEFRGKSSIKRVLPVLAPDHDYDQLNIGNGVLANVKWHHMTDGRMDADEAAQTYEDLLAYCNLDTLAMVKIYERLIELSGE